MSRRGSVKTSSYEHRFESATRTVDELYSRDKKPTYLRQTCEPAFNLGFLIEDCVRLLPVESKVKQNVVPDRPSVSGQRRPLCNSMMERQMGSPKPIPFSLV